MRPRVKDLSSSRVKTPFLFNGNETREVRNITSGQR